METYCFLHDLDAFAPHRCFHTKTVLFLSFLQGSRWNWEIHFKAVDDAILFFFFNPFVEGLYRNPLCGYWVYKDFANRLPRAGSLITRFLKLIFYSVILIQPAQFIKTVVIYIIKLFDACWLFSYKVTFLLPQNIKFHSAFMFSFYSSDRIRKKWIRFKWYLFPKGANEKKNQYIYWVCHIYPQPFCDSVKRVIQMVLLISIAQVLQSKFGSMMHLFKTR